MTDPYRVLGVPRSADSDTIRKAFKKLAKRYHPDVSQEPDAEERFKAVNGAYAVLGDEEKRKAWDEFGEASTRPGFDANRARAFHQGGMGGFPGGDMDDLLSSLFRGGSPRGPRRGPDQRATLSLTFLESVLGVERDITVPREAGRTESMKVRIPAGVKHGGKLRLQGRGLPPRGGGTCGDLHLELQIRPHPLLRRSGNDLEMDLPLTILEAMAGTTVTVPTPTGDVKVNIPPGVKPKQRLRLKGRGIQKTIPGHLYLILVPTPPQSTDPDVLAAAQRLEEVYTSDVRSQIKL